MTSSLWNMETTNNNLSVVDVMPDGQNGWRPVPSLLTETEACLYLRLDTIQVKNPGETLRRYRKAGLLKAVQISKVVLYPKTELERFVRNLMEKNPR